MSTNRIVSATGSVVGGNAVPTMNDLFVDPRTLPTPPMAVLEIMRRADDPDVYMADIVDLIESDVSIAVQVLRLANSALYAPASEITTVTRAATLLGLRTIRSAGVDDVASGPHPPAGGHGGLHRDSRADGGQRSDGPSSR